MVLAGIVSRTIANTLRISQLAGAEDRLNNVGEFDPLVCIAFYYACFIGQKGRSA